MAPYPNIVVMGVSGCGKSSIAARLALRLGATFIEGDGFHSAQNIVRMASGIALTDVEREGWLQTLAARLAAGRQRGERMVLACSALKRHYRDVLRSGDPALLFVHLYGDYALIAQRMAERPDHFMPLTLLDSQFRDLQVPQVDEAALYFDVHATPAALVEAIIARLFIGT